MGFDPRAVAESLVWLKPELLLTLVGFVLLAFSAARAPELRRKAPIVAVFGLIVAGVVLASYAPWWPLAGPKAGSDAVAFLDAAGRPAFVADGFSLVLKAVFVAGAILCILMAARFMESEEARSGEFYAVVVFAVVGMMFLASGNDFATIYIGLETMALASYVLVGYTKGNRRSTEGALKYFLLGAFASGVLLYGISLVYGTTGSYNLDGIAHAIAAGPRGPFPLLQVGAILVLVGMAFKVAAVPFHMWTPDAYEGAPTPATAFISTAAKAGAFAMLLRVFLHGFYGLARDWVPLFALLAVASMTLGNVVAIVQDNVKRMLAYSSIAHAGYMLMGVIAVGAAGDNVLTQRYGLTAVVLYLVVYTFTNAGAFALVVLLRRREVVGDRIDDFRGLARTNPVAAATMLVFLLSLAGIPCTSGFIGKWWLFGAAIQADYAWLAVVAVVNSTISLYFYARVVVAMYMREPAQAERVPMAPGVRTALVISAAFTLGIGLYPQPFIRMAQFALLPLGGP
jgi:NADH-quinone oxidoreductase subunit N